MVRRKVKLQYIENDTARKASYKKRVNSLVKKSQELSILCGVDTFAVVYGPTSPSPILWPLNETEAKRVLLKYKSKPDIHLSQTRLDHVAFLKQSVAKSEEKLARLTRKNCDMEMENVVSDLLAGKPIQQVPLCAIRELLCGIDDKLRLVDHMIRNMEAADNAPNTSANRAVNPALNLTFRLGNSGDGQE